MKTKHTTGPWRIAEIGQSWKVKDECVIATCENATGVYSVCILAKTNTNHYTKTDAEANVKLIAAAPDLLNALNELLASYEVCVKKADKSEFVINARAAINKATN